VSAGTAPPNAAEIVAHARRSLVAVRGGAAGGTGWVVLGNGLVMTSHEAVGYEPSVRVETASGRRTEGRVIWVDVARDLALVLPAEQLSLPPLLSRPDLPRLGESVLAVGTLPDAPPRVVSALVSAVDVRVGPLRCFEVDAHVATGGGPILDTDGRVVGIGGLDLPRGARRRAVPEALAARSSVAIPISALSRALAAVDIAPHQFEGRSPTYRCPACNEPFRAVTTGTPPNSRSGLIDERCQACGRLLPHAWEVKEANGRSALAERLVQDLMAELGASSTSWRVGPRTFRLSARGTQGTPIQITLETDEQGATIRGKIALFPVPSANQEPFYRFLLSLNDQAGGSQRFSIEDDTVYLSFVEPTGLLRLGEGLARVQELVHESDKLRKGLAESFEIGTSD
jgi:hypothetical protein